MTDPTRRGFLHRLVGTVAAIVAAPVALKAAEAAPAKTVLPTGELDLLACERSMFTGVTIDSANGVAAYRSGVQVWRLNPDGTWADAPSSTPDPAAMRQQIEDLRPSVRAVGVTYDDLSAAFRRALDPA